MCTLFVDIVYMACIGCNNNRESDDVNVMRAGIQHALGHSTHHFGTGLFCSECSLHLCIDYAVAIKDFLYEHNINHLAIHFEFIVRLYSAINDVINDNIA